MKKLKTAFILNICIFVSEVFAIGWMVSGVSSGLLSASRTAVLKYFTVDSNILMGIFALIAAISERKALKGKKEGVSPGVYALKLTGTAGVTLTMIITVFYLTPVTAAAYGPFAMYYNSNFFLHLLDPILSLICFLGFEKTKKIAFCHTFTAVVPMLIYAVYYVAAALAHSSGGVIAAGYDWYGFFFAGTRSVIVVLPVLVALTYGISYALWKLNRRKA